MNYALMTVDANAQRDGDVLKSIQQHLKLLGAEAFTADNATITIYAPSKDYNANKLYTFERDSNINEAFVLDRKHLFTQVTRNVHVLFDTLGGAFKAEKCMHLEARQCRLHNITVVINVASLGPVRCLLIELFGTAPDSSWQDLKEQLQLACENMAKMAVPNLQVEESSLTKQRAQAMMEVLPQLRLL
eukprot:m.43536 g.43536  ORF g.43536 m.43536 type:complete len:188 (+) comp12934_c0_seq1:159-722(+)